MKIEITFTIRDVETILAEHCRKQFKVDPKSVDVQLSPAIGEYVGKVEGDYRPD